MQRLMILAEKFKSFMTGRYGLDRLGIFLFVLYLLINGIGWMLRFKVSRIVTMIIALLILGFAIYRILSKNIIRRRKEGDFFDSILTRINFVGKSIAVRNAFKHLSLRFKFIKTHRFRKCHNCGEFLRISKKRGKRNITCPCCGKKIKTYVLF